MTTKGQTSRVRGQYFKAQPCLLCISDVPPPPGTLPAHSHPPPATVEQRGDQPHQPLKVALSCLPSPSKATSKRCPVRISCLCPCPMYSPAPCLLASVPTSDLLVARPPGQRWPPSPACSLPSTFPGSRAAPTSEPLGSLLHRGLCPWSPLRSPRLASSPAPPSLGNPLHLTPGLCRVLAAPSSPLQPPSSPQTRQSSCWTPSRPGLPWPKPTSSFPSLLHGPSTPIPQDALFLHPTRHGSGRSSVSHLYCLPSATQDPAASSSKGPRPSSRLQPHRSPRPLHTHPHLIPDPGTAAHPVMPHPPPVEVFSNTTRVQGHDLSPLWTLHSLQDRSKLHSTAKALVTPSRKIPAVLDGRQLLS